MTHDEERLRARFADLRRYDERSAPDFQRMRSAPRRSRRSAWRVIVPGASLAAAAMFVLWCGAQPMASAPQAVAPASAPVRGEISATAVFDPAPLDFLLEMPGASASIATPWLDARSVDPIRGW